MITIGFHNFWRDDDFVLLNVEMRILYELEPALFMAFVVGGLGVSVCISR